MDGWTDAQKKWHIEVGAPPKYIKLATFQQWAKGSREAASEGPTVLLIHFCSLCNAALVESLVIVIFYMIFLMCYAVIIILEKKIFHFRENSR